MDSFSSKHQPSAVLTVVVCATRCWSTSSVLEQSPSFRPGFCDSISGSSPVAYAVEVMPKDAAGVGMGFYRCAGDLGANPVMCLQGVLEVLDCPSWQLN